MKGAAQQRHDQYDQENWESSENSGSNHAEEDEGSHNQGSDHAEGENQDADMNIEVENIYKDDPTLNIQIDTDPTPPAQASMAPLTSQEIEALIDEDPLAAIDSLIGKALSKSSAKTQQSSVQEINQPRNHVAEKLDSLRTLLFQKAFLKNLPKDAELRGQIRTAFDAVENLAPELTLEQKKGVDDCRSFFEKCLITIDKVENVQAEFQRIEEGKLAKVSILRETREKYANLQSGIKSAEAKEKKYGDEIAQLEERLKKLKEDKTLLKAAREKCEEQQKECIQSVKLLSNEVAEFSAKEQENEAMANIINAEYERLKGEYHSIKASSPF